MKSFLPFEDAFVSRDFTPSAPSADRQSLGEDLKSMFDSLTSGPMPDRLVQLADALEEAFHRGDLFEPRGRLDS